MNPNIRRSNESQHAYRERRRIENAILKIRSRGHLLWNASRGTYIRAKHGDLKRP